MLEFINTLLGLGAAVFLPVLLFIMGLIFKMKPINALRAGVTVGIGMVAISLVTSLMTGQIMSPIINALVTKFGLSLTAADLAFPFLSAVTFGSGIIVVVMFAVFIGINFIMLYFNWTNCLNIDIWNYWHYIIFSAMTYYMTNNIFLAIIPGAIYLIIALALVKPASKVVSEHIGFEGICPVYAGFPIQVMLMHYLDKLIDKIPVINKINFSLKGTKSNSKMRIFTEPLFLGLIMGAVLSIVAGFAWQQVLTISVKFAAAMVILPKMTSLLIEGMEPITTAVHEFMESKFPGRQLVLSVDAATILDSEMLTVSALLTPVTLILALIVPGVTMLPTTSLSTLMFFCVSSVVATQHNSFRTLLFATLWISMTLVIASQCAPILTTIAPIAGIEVTGLTTGMAVGNGFVGYILMKIVEFVSALF